MEANKYTIEYHWREFLRLMGLNERTMPPDQLQIMKQTYYGAFGQMLMLLKDLPADCADDDELMADKLEDLHKEASKYWVQFLPKN